MAFDKKAHVAKLIGNGWAESDRAELEKLSDALVEKILPTPVAVAPAVTNAGEPAAATPVAQPKPLTNQEWLNTCPTDLSDYLREGLQAAGEQKASLIAGITANAANTFTPEQLTAMAIPTLKAVAALAATPVKNTGALLPNYFGTSVPAFAQNTATVEILHLPSTVPAAK